MLRRTVAVLAVVFAVAPLARSEPIVLEAVHWDDWTQRWKDIADNAYSSAMAATYETFYDDKGVALDYGVSGSTFSGFVTGTGLKPFFCYQIKLVGQPELTWGAAGGDDVTNENLGYAGRWWLTVYDANGSWLWARNSSDSEYDSWKLEGFVDPVTSERYVFEGYLVFDYVVTDKNGAFSKTLHADSSYHVVYKTSQRAPVPGVDSVPTTHVVAPKTGEWYPKKRYPRKSIKLYAEWEYAPPARPLPGDLVLPAREDSLPYKCQFVLTEESFHAGSWATVLRAYHVTFFIDHTPPPITADFSAMPTSGTAPLDVTFIDLSAGTVETREWDFNDDGVVDSTAETPTFTYENPGTYTVVLTVAGPSGQDTETKTDYITVNPAGTSPNINIQSVVANNVVAGSNYAITVSLTNDGGEGTVTLQCKITGAKTQVLSQKTITVPPGGGPPIVWTDAVSKKMKPGDYTATVTILDTAIQASNPFAITGSTARTPGKP